MTHGYLRVFLKLYLSFVDWVCHSLATTADSHLPRSAAHLVWFGSKCCVKKPLIRLEARIIYSCRFPILENRLSMYKLSCKDGVRHCLKCLSYNVQPDGSDTRSCSTVFFVQVGARTFARNSWSCKGKDDFPQNWMFRLKPDQFCSGLRSVSLAGFARYYFSVVNDSAFVYRHKLS